MRQKLFFIAALIGLSSIAWAAILVPLAQWRSATLSDLAKVQNERLQLSQSIARLRVERHSYATEDLTGLVWEAAQTAEATARVQSAVNDIARQNGIVMRSIAPTTGQGSQLQNAIAFRLEFEASLDQLVPFLGTIEFGQPVLVITRANLRRLARPNVTGTQPDLFVQIDLAAPVTLRDRSQG